MNSFEDTAIRHLDNAIRENSLIIFVGAGVSMESGLPSWNTLVDEFKNDIALPSDEDDNLKIAQYYYDTVGQQQYYQKILDIFQQNSTAQPNKIHDEIFRIRPRHIITTNYDSLLEQRMASDPFKYEVIKEDADIPYARSDHYIVKMHGDLSLKNLVLKEDDYLDYENNFYMVSNLIKSLIMNNTILFIGYSLRDSTFNSIFRLIQKGFAGNAKKAHFFTPDEQYPAVVEYYKHKGITVITGNLKNVGADPGKCTVKFLSHLGSKKPYTPVTSDQIWDNISFLDKLYFVDTHDVESFTNLGDKVLLNPATSLNWTDTTNEPIEVKTNKRLIDFIDSKTMFMRFIDHKRNDENKFRFKQNPVLAEGFSLYRKGQYHEARRWFRETANKAYAGKDYWNYMVAEFDAEHIPDWASDYTQDEPVPKPIVGSLTFEQTIETLISNGDEETRRLCRYFQDTILNFSFLYTKTADINDSLDSLRNEHTNYKHGGSSFNSLLSKARVEFHSLLYFIEENCLTVFEYTEFKAIANRYFECLIIAYANSNHVSQGVFNTTSSVINKLTLEDVQTLVVHLNEKNLPALMDSYNLSKIKIEEGAEDYLISHIRELEKQNNQNTYQWAQERELHQYAGFLSFVNLTDINKLIRIIPEFPLQQTNADIVRKLLVLLVSARDSIQEEEYPQVSSLVNQHLSTIITNDLIQMHTQNFFLYNLLMQTINSEDRRYAISIQSLEEKWCYINDKPEHLTDITKYCFFIAAFYEFFDTPLKSLIDEILVKYEKLDNQTIDVDFAAQMTESNVHSFDDQKNLILDTEIKRISKNKNPRGYEYPDQKKVSASHLFNLYENGYFKLADITTKIDIETLRGIYPEIDWTLLKDHSDATIAKLVHDRGFANARKAFGDTDEERDKIDDWLVRQAVKGDIRIPEQ